MKFLGLFVCLVAAVYAQTETEVLDPLKDNKEGFVRELPADVLRDFPGQCFASTQCRVFQIGDTWPLTPFCGKASCLQHPSGVLIERVNDCGPLPKPNEKCKVANEVDANKTFPDCCPKFECDKGVTLQFDQVPVAPPQTETAPHAASGNSA